MAPLHIFPLWLNINLHLSIRKTFYLYWRGWGGMCCSYNVFYNAICLVYVYVCMVLDFSLLPTHFSYTHNNVYSQIGNWTKNFAWRVIFLCVIVGCIFLLLLYLFIPSLLFFCVYACCIGGYLLVFHQYELSIIRDDVEINENYVCLCVWALKYY